MNFGDFEIRVIQECSFKLDGGAMFGVVPKTIWNKLLPADEQNRIKMCCNLLFLDNGKDKLLIETGMGERWTDKEKERFELTSYVESTAVLDSIGIANIDVTAVVLSHLHFDHAGGATRFDNGKIIPTFPNAKYYVQRGEWEFAEKANPRARASYRKDDYLPLQQSGQLELMDGDTEIIPGVWAKLTGGHTTHHQMIYFESGSNKGVFFADLMPTKSHITPPWVMGYDHYPLESCDRKTKWLKVASAENWLVVFDHEPEIPWGHIHLNEQGKYVFAPLAGEAINTQIRYHKFLAQKNS